MFKVYPPLWYCVKFSVKTLGLILVIVLLFGIAARFFNGEPFMGLFHILQLSLFFFGLAALLGAILYMLFRALAWSVEPLGIAGRSYWCRRSFIFWSDVEKVRFISIEGIPALVVTSTKSKREVYAYTLGANATEIHAYLSRHAGPDHVLTQWFKPAA